MVTVINGRYGQMVRTTTYNSENYEGPINDLLRTAREQNWIAKQTQDCPQYDPDCAAKMVLSGYLGYIVLLGAPYNTTDKVAYTLSR